MRDDPREFTSPGPRSSGEARTADSTECSKRGQRHLARTRRRAYNAGIHQVFQLLLASDTRRAGLVLLPERLPMNLPLVVPVRQTATQLTVSDLDAEVRRQWQASSLPRRVRPGNRVAIAVGSRGIAHLSTIVRATIEALIELGAEPFVVAAMGSHGGATPEGQRQLLAGLRDQRGGPESARQDRHDHGPPRRRIAGVSQSSGTRTPSRATRW